MAQTKIDKLFLKEYDGVSIGDYVMVDKKHTKVENRTGRIRSICQSEDNKVSAVIVLNGDTLMYPIELVKLVQKMVCEEEEE